MKKRPIPIVYGSIHAVKYTVNIVLYPFKWVWDLSLYGFTGRVRCSFCERIVRRNEPLHTKSLNPFHTNSEVIKICEDCSNN